MIDGKATISPSKIGPSWTGTPVEGSEFTEEQLEVLKRERPTWKTFHRRPVKLAPIGKRDWTEDDTTVIECPIIAWTKDRERVLIVTPGGDKHWVSAIRN